MGEMIENIGGEMKKELPSITIFGTILYFTNRQSEKFAVKEI